MAIANPPHSAAESRAARMVRKVFDSGRPLTYIRTAEEQRVASVLREVAGSLLPIWTWSLTEGMLRNDGAAELGTQDARMALDFIIAHAGVAIFHLKDFHEPLREYPEVRRRLRDVYSSCLDRRKFVVITAPVQFIPDEVERSVLFMELRPPDSVELVDFLRREVQPTPVSEAILEQMALALRGLTLDEARFAPRSNC